MVAKYLVVQDFEIIFTNSSVAKKVGEMRVEWVVGLGRKGVGEK